MLRRWYATEAANQSAGVRYSQLKTTWEPALKNVGNSRASIAVIGDSITDGFSATNFDSTDYVSALRAVLQTKYGNGGEGFISAIHAEPTGEAGWENPPANRWAFTGSRWTPPSFDTRNGYGGIAGSCYWNSTSLEPHTTATFNKLQVMTAIKFDNTSHPLIVKIDGNTVDTIELGNDLITHANLAPGTVSEYSVALGAHTVTFDVGSGVFVWVEGIRPLIGTTGIVVDRFGKSGMRAEWLGNANDSDYTNYTNYYKTLFATFDVLDEDLFIIMLGVLDYQNQVALATFETALTVIANRAKAKADCILVIPPQPNSSLTIPFSSYVAKIQAVAAATGCLCLDVYARWGSAYNATYMQNDVHPNDAGHADIATYLYDSIKLV